MTETDLDLVVLDALDFDVECDSRRCTTGPHPATWIVHTNPDCGCAPPVRFWCQAALERSFSTDNRAEKDGRRCPDCGVIKYTRWVISYIRLDHKGSE